MLTEVFPRVHTRMAEISTPFQTSGQSMYPILDQNGKYRNIPILSPGLTFVQKAVLLGLFSGELIFGGACYQKEFCISKWV